jgi:hypothetical protein
VSSPIGDDAIIQEKKGLVSPFLGTDFLQLKVVREFDEEYVMTGEAEEILEIVPERKIAPAVRIRSALGPDQIQGGSRPVFPPDDEVGSELQEVEVWIVYTVIDSAILVFIDAVDIPLKIIAYLIIGKGVEAVCEFFGSGVGDVLEPRVFPGRDERLSVELDGEIWGETEIHPQGHSQGFLVDPSEKISFSVLKIFLAHVLEIFSGNTV